MGGQKDEWMNEAEIKNIEFIQAATGAEPPASPAPLQVGLPIPDAYLPWQAAPDLPS